MNLAYQLNLEQSHKLIMTPQLRQAIEILQYSSQELEQHIYQEMLENPLIEIDVELSERITNVEAAGRELDLRRLARDNDMRMQTRYHMQNEAERPTYENVTARRETLRDHLYQQLQYLNIDSKLRELIEYLIECVDGAGYLRCQADFICRHFAVENSRFEKAVKLLQSFEPRGVAARDLKECLMLQIDADHAHAGFASEIINHCLEALANNRLKVIAKQLHCSVQQVQAAADYIKTLHPKPGMSFADRTEVNFIRADVELVKHGQSHSIIVKDSTAPRLFISKFYRKLLEKESFDEKTNRYIAAKYSRVLQLIKSIEQRRSTLYRVVESIMKYQQDFLAGGKVYLKPLTMKTVAEDIGVHESTVSRAVSGKYLQTERGLFELKYFFQSGVQSPMGDGVSASSIQMIIADLIDNEDVTKPLSDQMIADQINQIGVAVSRRTIAKYRSLLGIASSSRRRRYCH